MTARGRFVARLVTMLIALAGFVTVGALPAAAGNSGTVQYVALGDSYAAGQGGGGRDLDPPCLESPNGYPYLLDAEKRIHLQTNAACTGASTDEVESGQLSALNRGTRLVTLTAGAADLNLSGVLAACTAVPPEGCKDAIDGAPGELSGLGGSLTNLYIAVADAAPNAHIVVTGYPHLFALLAGDPNAAIKAQINGAVTLLNETIEEAVTATRVARVDIVYVDVREKFAQHGIGSLVPFINAAGPGAFHPNAAGYRAYAEAITAELASTGLDDTKQAA